MKIYIIEGGVGRQIMFTSLIPSLSKKDNEQIITMSPYPNIFENNPYVYRSLNRNTPFAWEDFIMNDKHEVVYCDPYFDDQFIKRKCHVLEGWSRQLGIPYDINMLPELFLPKIYEDQAKQFKEQNGEFVIMQFASGQSPIGSDMNQPFIYSGFERNYPKELAQELIIKFNKEFPDIKVVIYGLPNEGYHFEGTYSVTADYLYYAALLKESKGFVGINSSLMHMAGAQKVKGVVLWGGTSNNQWGWTIHEHISGNCDFNNLYCSKPYLRDLGDYNSTGRWICSKPKCMNISTDIIIDKLKTII
jgi:hypothetical protein